MSAAKLMHQVENPEGLENAKGAAPGYGSDALAQVLSSLQPGIDYIALNPGASVHHKGNCPDASGRVELPRLA
jgi:hypothetical protein